jgi:hypothetical protein
VALATGGSVVANGGVTNEKEGVATFWANIQQDSLKTSQFIFASEGTHGHGDYPDVVFKSISIDMYMDMGNTVMVRGRGLLYHMIPVDYMGMFVDNGRGIMDEIQLHAWNTRNLAHVVHFVANLTDGNIAVTPGK